MNDKTQQAQQQTKQRDNLHKDQRLAKWIAQSGYALAPWRRIGFWAGGCGR